MIEHNKLSELVDIESSNHFRLLVEECEKRGFIQYEISNFGKKITSLITIQTIGLVQNILELDHLLILIMGKVEVGIFLTIQNIYSQ